MVNAFLTVLWLRLRQWWLRRRTIRLLSELDGHMLRDIGLDRYTITNSVDSHLQRSPTVVSNKSVSHRAGKLRWRKSSLSEIS